LRTSSAVTPETERVETPPLPSSTCTGKSAEDCLAYIDGKLHWTVSSLVLFIDSSGVARVPKQFFWAVCDRGWRHGSVGPMYRSVLLGAVKLIAITVFLAAIWFATVRLVENAYHTSTVSQAALVLVVGSLPLIGHVLSRLVRSTSGRNDAIADTIKSILQPTTGSDAVYRQSWPVNDMAFHWRRRWTTATTGSNALSNGDVVGDDRQNLSTTHVDLLINVFDDDVRDSGSRRVDAVDEILDVDVGMLADVCCSTSSNSGGIISPA
jgi:hypothetical protein